MSKVNPRRKPVNQAQLDRTADRAFKCAILIMISCVVETEKFTNEEITNLWQRINYKSDSVVKGFVKLKDISQALLEEYNIEIEVI